jgi:eukaryotic-like serine/threonine-protein kinase
MGEVYKARDPFIGRLVALKVITGGLAGRPDLLDRFYQEARSAGALQHPNIVTIYELGKEGELPFIAMEYLSGESLERIVSRKAGLPLATKVAYISQICSALGYAHKHGVVHRDIKPGNIMVTSEDAVKVVDFGIARLVDASKTQTGTLIGTLAYMSPQQIRGEHADERSDIWAVGVLFYELLCYRRPFHGENPPSLMMCIVSREPQPVEEIVPDCPPEVGAIIRKMLHKDAGQRYQSMEEALLDLETALRQLRQQRVHSLVEEGRRLIDARNWPAAQQVLRDAVHIDPAHREAKNLLEKTSQEVRRQQALPRIKEQIAKAQGMLEAGRFEQAKAEAEAALQLDSTFEPARELLAEVERQAARAGDLDEKLRLAKQRLIEGALTLADQQLDEALAIDPASPQARELRKQIHEELDRREKRKHLAESLHRAREMWTQLRYGDCIALLTEVQKEFPVDAEVAKLLETARNDRADEHKREKLGEARNLLAAQRYEDAGRLLSGLLVEFPRDSAVESMLALVEQERDTEARQKRLQEELAAIRELVNQGNHAEALRRGEPLLKEFPQEFGLEEAVNFARAELRRTGQARALEERIGKVRALMAQGSLAEAIRTADLALAEFPRRPELLALKEQAQAKQKEHERQELIDRRIRELKSRINREDLTGAIELAKQTIAAVGADTDLTQLLQAAEVEREHREKKKEQEQQVQAAETLLRAGRVDDATRILDQAVETQLVDPADPRVKAFLEAVARKKQETAAAARPPAPAPSSPVVPQPAAPAPLAGEAAKDYVYQTGAPLGSAPAAPEDVLPKEAAQPTAFSATKLSDATVSPARARPAPVSPPATEVRAQQATPPATEVRAQQATPPARERPSRPAVEAPAPKPPETVERAGRKSPVPIAVAVVGFGIAIVLGLYFGLRPGSSRQSRVAPPPAASQPTPVAVPANSAEQQQEQLMAQAQQLAAQGDYSGALAKANEALKLNGPLQQNLQNLLTQLQSAAANNAASAAPPEESQLWEQAIAEFRQDRLTAAERDFRQVSNGASGAYKTQAANFLNNLIPQARKSDKLFSEAEILARKTRDAQSLLQADQDLREVIATAGPRSQQAERLQAQVARDLAGLGSRASNAAAPAPAPSVSSPTSAPPAAPTTSTPAASTPTAAAPVASAPAPASSTSVSTVPPQPGAAVAPTRIVWLVTVDTSQVRVPWQGKLKNGELVEEQYLDTRLALLSHPLPYDVVQRMGGNRGQISLQLTVDPQGRVTGGRVASGDASLGQAAIAAAEQGWQFSQPRVHKKPVSTTANVRIQF